MNDGETLNRELAHEATKKYLGDERFELALELPIVDENFIEDACQNVAIDMPPRLRQELAQSACAVPRLLARYRSIKLSHLLLNLCLRSMRGVSEIAVGIQIALQLIWARMNRDHSKQACCQMIKRGNELFTSHSQIANVGGLGCCGRRSSVGARGARGCS